MAEVRGRMDGFERSLEVHAAETRDALTDIKESIAQLSTKVDATATEVASTREVVAAWNFVKTGQTALKWILGIVAAIAAAWAAVRGVIHR